MLIPEFRVVPLYLSFIEKDQGNDEEEPNATMNQEEDIEVGYAADTRLLHVHPLTTLKSQSSEYKSDSDDEEEEEEEEEEKPQLQYRPVFIPKCVISSLILVMSMGSYE